MGSKDETKSNDKKELELQLHEQYAINNNANLSSIIGLITATIVVVGFYGYAFVRSSLEYSDSFKFLTDDGCYTMNTLLLMASGTVIILAILQYICMYQGYQQRNEQFIIYAIRCKYYQEKPEQAEDSIYPSNYTPFDKGMLQYVQGLFGELFKIFGLLQIIIILSIVGRYLINGFSCLIILFNCLKDLNEFWLFIFTFLVCLLVNICQLIKK